MEYIALIVVFVALSIGAVCGVVQNSITHKKNEKVNIRITDSSKDLSTVCSLLPSESLLVYGNVSLIEKRYADDVNVMMDNTFGEYERV